MKLLFSISYFSPYVSGATIYAKRLAEALSRNYSCKVITIKHESKLQDNETINNVEIIRARPSFFVSKGAISWDFVIKSWLLVRDTDVVIINLPEFEGFITALWARLMTKKVISIYHCDVNLPPSFKNQVVQSVLDFANTLSLALSHIVVAYTADYAEHSRLLPLFKSKTKIILPPVVPLQIDPKLKSDLIMRIGRPKIVIGVAARLAAEKGIEYLLDTIPILEKNGLEFKIIIAGPGNPIGEETYQYKIKAAIAKYHTRVIFLETIPPEKMGSFYALLDMLVLPSVNSTESFGLVQVEAMLMGVPVIATNLPGVRVPVHMTHAGLIIPVRDTLALTEAITEIAHQPKKYRPTHKVQELFSLTQTLTDYEHLFLS